MTKLQFGDRIAYGAKFLKDTGQRTGGAGDRRGVFLRLDSMPGYARVRWDDDEAHITAREGYFSEQDYCDEIRVNGSLVHVNVIAKVGSAKFACNDIS